MIRKSGNLRIQFLTERRVRKRHQTTLRFIGNDPRNDLHCWSQPSLPKYWKTRRKMTHSRPIEARDNNCFHDPPAGEASKHQRGKPFLVLDQKIRILVWREIDTWSNQRKSRNLPEFRKFRHNLSQVMQPIATSISENFVATSAE